MQLERKWMGPPRDGGPELVLLHEGLGSLAQWRDVPDRLGRPALVYSRQGYGQSPSVAVPRPLTYMHDEAARLPELLALEHVREPILVGHSDGASIAIIAAGSHAVNPRGLVLIAPHVFVEAISIESIAKARDAYSELRPKLARYHADVDGAFWGWNRAWLDPGFRSWNIEAFLPAITAPVLIVQGDADEYGTLAQVDAIQRAIPTAEALIIRGAGHSPFRDPSVVASIARKIGRMVETGLANSNS
ncbi:MAG TPA: alpha/beta hydrolase [Kofleriaceae bacterium]|jgi:pimeloyl-ACP methyl ester carboxylesterase|nr:alpha/beta hydrolase [Kofleriaceae bacterium]